MEYIHACPILDRIIAFCKTAKTTLKTPTGAQFFTDSSLIVDFSYNWNGGIGKNNISNYFVIVYINSKGYRFTITGDEYRAALNIINNEDFNILF